eukprot:gene13171-3969_t
MEEMTRSLKPLELELCKRMDLVYVRGKRSRKVPILLTAEIVNAMKALIKTRDAVGVSNENKYVFAAPSRGSLNYLRGPDCLNAVVKSCQLKNPSAIKSTQLRKYVATVSQIIDLNSSELDWLARHMGHDISVHREYYRLHDSTLELAKVSKLLLAVDEGNSSKWLGRNLDQIQLDDLPMEQAEVSSDEESDGDDGGVGEHHGDVDMESEPEKEDGHAGKRRVGKRSRWGKEESSVVLKHYADKIKKGVLPGKSDATQLITESAVLKNRTWQNVKDFVRNHIAKAKRLSSK